MVAMRNQTEHIGIICSLKCKKYYFSIFLTAMNERQNTVKKYVYIYIDMYTYSETKSFLQYFWLIKLLNLYTHVCVNRRWKIIKNDLK